MRANWITSAAIVVLIIMVALLVQRLTRRVAPYHYQLAAENEQPAWGTADSQTARRLQARLDEPVNTLQVPGLQAYVRDSDGSTWSGASGTIDLARRVPMQRDHVVRVGSTTKTFIAVVILKLVEAGKLGLDDPLAKWFPDIPHADVITIRQLLNHTSGIPEFLENPQVIMKSIMPSLQWQPHEVIDIGLQTEPYFEPGAGWRYSNTNYVLLGLIAERVSGRTAAQLLREMIIDPLGLSHTYFVPYEPAPRMLVTGFDRDLSRFPGLLDIAPNNTSWATAASTSGALASNADDLGRLYASLFDSKLLSSTSMAEMTTFVSAANPGFEVQDGYGLGLMRLNVGGQELIGHVGEFMGSTAIALYAPERHQLIVVTTNLSYPNLVDPLLALQAALP